MARVTTVKKSQKPTTCEKCGKALPAGSSYKWCAPRAGKFARGRKRIRCSDCPRWRASETTSSGHLATLYGAQEAFGDALNAWDGEDAEALRSALTDLASGVREAGESYGESAQNIEDGFQHETSMSQELREKSESLVSWADEIESAAEDIEDFDEDAALEEAEEEVYTGEAPPEDETDEQKVARLAEFQDDIKQAVEERRASWAEEQRSKAEEQSENCPL